MIKCSKDIRAAFHVGICQLAYATSKFTWEGERACITTLMRPLWCSSAVIITASCCSLNAHRIPAPMHSAVEVSPAVLGVSLHPVAGVHNTVSVQRLYGYWEVLQLPSAQQANMRRERVRLLSRRGGSGGRAVSQRSSDTLEPERRSPPSTRSGRGRGRGRSGEVVSELAAHQTARYRFPCSFDNAIFIISVSIEKLEDNSNLGAAQAVEPVEQRIANPEERLRSVSEDSSSPILANPAGPGVSVRGDPTGSVAPHSDSEDLLRYGCLVVEEPYTTDDD